MKRSGIAEKLEQFSGRNTFGFTIQEVVRKFPQKNRSQWSNTICVYLDRILADMVDKGILCKIVRDTLIRNSSNLNVLDY